MSLVRKLFFSAATCLFFSLPSHAGVDLFSSLPQRLPDQAAGDIYHALWNLGLERKDADGKHVIELINFYCQIADFNTPDPKYACSYGLHGEISGDYAHQIYDALVQAGFVSDCDRHDGTCDIDPIRSLSCEKTIDWIYDISYSCTITI